MSQPLRAGLRRGRAHAFVGRAAPPGRGAGKRHRPHRGISSARAPASLPCRRRSPPFLYRVLRRTGGGGREGGKEAGSRRPGRARGHVVAPQRGAPRRGGERRPQLPPHPHRPHLPRHRRPPRRPGRRGRRQAHHRTDQPPTRPPPAIGIVTRFCACSLAGEPELQERQGDGQEAGGGGALLQRGGAGAAAAPVARRAQGEPARGRGVAAGAAIWGRSGPGSAPAGEHSWLSFHKFFLESHCVILTPEAPVRAPRCRICTWITRAVGS